MQSVVNGNYHGENDVTIFSSYFFSTSTWYCCWKITGIMTWKKGCTPACNSEGMLWKYASRKYATFPPKISLKKQSRNNTTFTTLMENSAEDKFIIFSYFHISSYGDNLHEMTKTIFWEKLEQLFQNVVCCTFFPSLLSAEAFQYIILAQCEWLLQILSVVQWCY